MSQVPTNGSTTSLKDIYPLAAKYPWVKDEVWATPMTEAEMAGFLEMQEQSRIKIVARDRKE